MGRKLGAAPARLIALAGAVLGVVACNAAVGGGVVALVGGAGYLAGQCYDRVRVKVRDAESGRFTCEAEVWVSDGDSERKLRPCYNAALTEGKWRVTALRPGYAKATTDLVIAEPEGECPHYTHSIELTLRREGALAPVTPVTPARPAAPKVTAPPAVSPAAPAAVPAPAPAAPPPVPMRSFEPVTPPAAADAGAPR